MKKRWLEAAAIDLTLVLILLALGGVCLRGRESVRAFKQNKAVYRADTEEKELALMMNVYQGEELLPEFLSLFEKEQMKITFFIGGVWAEKHPDTVKSIAQAGHELGNHGFHHKLHTRLTRQESREEIRQTNELLLSLTGQEVLLFAPPAGDVNDEVTEDARACGCTTVMWSADLIDWRDQDEEKLFARVKRNLKPGVLVLTHPTPATLRVLPRVIALAREQGYTFRTVGQLVGQEKK